MKGGGERGEGGDAVAECHHGVISFGLFGSGIRGFLRPAVSGLSVWVRRRTERLLRGGAASKSSLIPLAL